MGTPCLNPIMTSWRGYIGRGPLTANSVDLLIASCHSQLFTMHYLIDITFSGACPPESCLHVSGVAYRFKVGSHRDVSLASVDIDASKGFVDLWVHLFFAIFATFDQKRYLKLLEMACDQVQTCLIFHLRWEMIWK